MPNFKSFGSALSQSYKAVRGGASGSSIRSAAGVHAANFPTLRGAAHLGTHGASAVNGMGSAASHVVAHPKAYGAGAAAGGAGMLYHRRSAHGGIDHTNQQHWNR